MSAPVRQLLPFPHLADLSCVRPFAQRCTVALQYRKEFAACMQRWEEVTTQDKVWEPLSRIAEDVRRGWLRLLTWVLFEIDDTQFVSTDDVRAFDKAFREQQTTLRGFDGLFDTPSMRHVDEELVKVALLLADVRPKAEEVERMARRCSSTQWREEDSTDPSQKRPLMTDFEVELFGHVWLALPRISPTLVPPPPGSARASSDCLSHLNNWRIQVEEKGRHRGGRPKATNEMREERRAAQLCKQHPEWGVKQVYAAVKEEIPGAKRHLVQRVVWRIKQANGRAAKKRKAG